MKKLFNWNFASRLAIIFGIIGGVYLIYQLINHFTSEKIKLKSEVSIINYEVPSDKAITSYWRELCEIITSDFDSYFLSRDISDSLYEKVDLSSINKFVVKENIERAFPETFNREHLIDRLDSLLLKATYPMSSSKYFVSTFINNKGSKICKEMRFEIPTHGYYELCINDNLISKGDFKKNIDIGELRPENIATLKK